MAREPRFPHPVQTSVDEDMRSFINELMDRHAQTEAATVRLLLTMARDKIAELENE